MVGTFLTDPIFGDMTIEAHFSDAAITRAMLAVEAALATAQAQQGVFPQEIAERIADASKNLTIHPTDLADGVNASGVPVPALVACLRNAVGSPASDFVHFGATSQDIVDTATVLCLREALKDLLARLTTVLEILQAASVTHRNTIMLARTRGQLATPTTIGLRIAQWANPLIGLEIEAETVQSGVLRVQLGGGSGNRTALGTNAKDISSRLAEVLQLSDGPPWHTNRDALHRLASWLMRVTSACGKIGTDIGIASRSEVMEIRAGTGGASSTMPHKSNPVASEALEAVAAAAQAVFAGFTASAVHREERDGAAWSLEWLFLPQLFSLTGSALSLAQAQTSSLTINKDAMRQRIDETPAVMAEAAVFALAPTIGRERASSEVRSALAAKEALGQALFQRGFDDIDWDAVLDPTSVINNCAQVADQIFDQRPSKS